MPYLLPAEYEAFGLEAKTPDAWIALASSLIDAHCKRNSLQVTQYTERMRLAEGCQSARLSYRPLAVASGASSPLVSVRVRYCKPRRGEMLDPLASLASLASFDTFQASVAMAFGLPGSWNTLDAASVDINMSAAELTFPLNYLGIGFNEAEITYTAGLAIIPGAVKTACAQIARNAQATPALNVKSNRVDAVQMEYFSGVLIDAESQALLRPYVAERLG
ncbi:MAG: hypothetical protein FWD64_05785 [Acidobacteriaceae bacterium]|nr:hypothetical protein [Acidobacteriaceae bacterium]